MSLPAPWPARDAFYELRRAVVLFFFRFTGWRPEGAAPSSRRMVVIAAPHTTNWDLPIMLAVAYHYRVRLKWMGKDDLFKGPFGWVMKALGGVPVDRSKSNSLVAQMIEAFRRAKDDDAEFMLVVPPEGTRAKVRAWKSGFYNIAHGAGVAIALGFLDYARKRGGFLGEFATSGDYESDLERIKAIYAPIRGKYVDRYAGKDVA